MKNGFTLIELVIVIIILGMLATSAAPRMMDLSRDANIAYLQHLKGAIESTVKMVQAKAKIQGVRNGAININGVNIQVSNEYPHADWNSTFRVLMNVTDKTDHMGNIVCQQRVCTQGSSLSVPNSLETRRRNLMFWPDGKTTADNCLVWYHNGYQDTSGSQTMYVGIETSGC